MKYFSMFTGIGGFELGIQYANRSPVRGSKENTSGDEGQGLLSTTGKDTSSPDGRSSERPDNFSDERPLCVGYSEIDKYAIQTFEHHFGKEVKNYGDATKLNTSELPDFDLLVGGFPCQAFSLAGKRAGFEDTRGTLIFDVVRVLRDKRPRHFILENVKGLLSHEGGKTFAAILEILTDTGYDVSWSIHNSKNYGVPQNRERVYLIGNLRGERRPQVFPVRASNQEAVVSNTIRTGGQGSLSKKHAWDLIQINKPVHSNDRVYSDEGISPTLNTMQGGNRQPFIRVVSATKTGYEEATIGDGINIGAAGSSARRGRVQKEAAQTLNTSGDVGTYDGVSIRRLTPVECERLQGFPDGWTLGSDSQRYKQCGNAITVNVVEHVVRSLYETNND